MIMDMNYTGREIYYEYKGHQLRLCNQSCPEWTEPYPLPGNPDFDDRTLHTSGCGIFSLIHITDYLTGEKDDPAELAMFSALHGGRNEDGTDRPPLLDAMEKAGRLKKIGLRYDFDGLCNDHEALWQNMLEGGVALTDLRVGHIVALVDYRIVEGERQLLVIDSSRDSMHPAVRNHLCGVEDGTQITAYYQNSRGVITGVDTHYAMYWVPLSLPFDFSLLHRVACTGR